MTTKKKAKRKVTSAAELKRQVTAMKLEMAQKDEKIASLENLTEPAEPNLSPLSERWEPVLGDVGEGEAIYFLDGNDEAEAAGWISRIEQDAGVTLFQVEVGPRVAYFSDILDASEQGERWADIKAGKIYVPKNNPAIIRDRYESQDNVTGQDVPRKMASTGPAKDSLEPAYIQPVDRPVSLEKMEMLAFMEEEVEVMVHDTTDPQAVPIPCFWNDGISQYFIRGKHQTVKRKFVEILARCKKTTFTQETYKDANGAECYKQIPHTALMFPFSLEDDPNPRGRDWFRAVQAEA
jgi:hypothetical protein